MRINELFRTISIFINVWFLMGDSNESISQRTARAIYGPGEALDWVYELEWLINGVFYNAFWKIEREHVLRSYSPDVIIDYDPWSWKK